MDHTFHESLTPYCPFKDHDNDNFDPWKLLEHFWFFKSIFLDRKPRIMSETASDHSRTSSNGVMSGKSYEEAYKSIEKLPAGVQDESWPSNLIRAPSLPPRMERKDQNPATKGIDPAGGRRLLSVKTNNTTNNLLRAPSMPAVQKGEEIQDEESEFSMGKLIRQASLSNSDSSPPRRRATKGVRIANPSLSSHGSLRKMAGDKLEGSEKTVRSRWVMSQLKTQKSLNDLEVYQELQGIKDLGFDSESCHVQTFARPVTEKSTDDIKAQIKFWARIVASNVRQES